MKDLVSVKQRIALAAPVLLLAVMYPVFQLLGRGLGHDVGWAVGLAIYWVIWGWLYPYFLLGGSAIVELIRPRRAGLGVVALVAIPLVLVAVGRFAGVGYDKSTPWMYLVLLGTAIGNGFFEELLWRGTYTALFPQSVVLGVVWPSAWFALWHLAPGSISANGDLVRLILGAAVLGTYLGFLAKRTNTVWWSICVHTLAGLIMVA